MRIILCSARRGTGFRDHKDFLQLGLNFVHDHCFAVRVLSQAFANSRNRGPVVNDVASFFLGEVQKRRSVGSEQQWKLYYL